MTSWNSAFPSRFFRANDLNNKRLRLKISGVTLESLDDSGREKPVLYFENEIKGLALNRTNADVLEQRYGDQMEDAIGKVIELFPSTVRFKGQLTPCIRIAIPASQEPQGAGTAIHGGLSSETIPF